MTKNGILKVIEKNEQNVSCKLYRFEHMENLFVDPIESVERGIYQLNTNIRYTHTLRPLSELVQKCVALPYKDGYVIMPLIHGIN